MHAILALVALHAPIANEALVTICALIVQMIIGCDRKAEAGR